MTPLLWLEYLAVTAIGVLLIGSAGVVVYMVLCWVLGREAR